MRIRLISILTVIFAVALGALPTRLHAQSDKLSAAQVDSIVRLLPSMPEDSTKALALSLICSNHPNVDSTLQYTQELYSLSLKTGIKWQAMALRYLAWYFQTTGDYESAIKYGFKSLKLNDSIGEKYQMALNYNSLGECMINYGDYQAASEYFHKALNLLLDMNETAIITYTYRNLGIIYINYKLYDEAMNYLNEALKIDIANNNIRQQALDYYYMAFTKLNTHETYKDTAAIYDAKKLIERASAIFRELETEFHIMNSNLCQMQTYIDYAELQKPIEKQRLIDSSLVLYNEALNLADKNGYAESYVFLFELCKGKYLVATKQYAECEKTIRRLEKMTLDDPNNEGYLLDIYRLAVELFTEWEQYQKAVEYMEKLAYTEKREFDSEFAANSIELSAKDQFDIDMRNHDLDTQRQKLRYEANKKQRQMMILTVCLFALLLTGLAINIFRNNRRYHNTNIALMRKRENYRLQRSMLANANYEAHSSIMYAKQIQQAIVPTAEMMNATFGDTLIIWNPLDIISGDFYWAKQIGRFKMIAVADCTGHGIPGAFMSMLGMTSLNDIVAAADLDNTTAADILDKLRTKINVALRQNEDGGMDLDGMDIALCIIDTEAMKMQYAGAYRPLIIIRGGGMLEYFPDKMHIGFEPRKPESYTNHRIDIQTDDTIYLFTDGFGNQFSNEERGMKFTPDRLKKLLRTNSGKTFAEQKTIIEDALMKWRTSGLGHVCPQTDDQLLIGIRI